MDTISASARMASTTPTTFARQAVRAACTAFGATRALRSGSPFGAAITKVFCAPLSAGSCGRTITGMTVGMDNVASAEGVRMPRDAESTRSAAIIPRRWPVALSVTGRM